MCCVPCALSQSRRWLSLLKLFLLKECGTPRLDIFNQAFTVLDPSKHVGSSHIQSVNRALLHRSLDPVHRMRLSHFRNGLRTKMHLRSCTLDRFCDNFRSFIQQSMLNGYGLLITPPAGTTELMCKIDQKLASFEPGTIKSIRHNLFLLHSMTGAHPNKALDDASLGAQRDNSAQRSVPSIKLRVTPPNTHSRKRECA